VQARIGAAIVGTADPFGREARKKSDLTLRKVLADYLDARGSLKDRTREDYRQRVEEECFADWLDRPIAEISRDDVERRYVKLAANSESRAKGGFVVLRALFNYAMAKYENAGKPVIVDNPIRRLTATRRGWSRVKRRSDAIPLALMPRFFDAARAIQTCTSDYLQAIALTGLRRNEAARIEWRHVNLDEGTFTIEDTKNRDPLRLPITRQLRDVLERRRQAQKGRKVWRYVFPQEGADEPIAEPRKTLDAICEAIGHESTIHDLRRSFINAADASGLGFIVTKLLVNHRLPTGSDDVTVGYAARDPERLRHAAQRVADVLDGTTARAEVIQFAQGR
jgi:integrase